jgi:hypothetical protein
VQRHAAPDLGEHAHGVRRGGLCEVHRGLAVEAREVGRLAGGRDQLAQHGADALAEHLARDVAEAHQPGPERVAPAGLAAHVALGDERREQAVDARGR